MGRAPALLSFLLHILFLLGRVRCSAVAAFGRRSPPSTDGVCARLIRPLGYPCSEHAVETEDGYILSVQHIPYGRRALAKKSGPPIFLQHGLFQGGDTWFMNSAEESLGFILADSGFDVWVGNVRGTHWSYGHVTLSENDKAFWDWSWQELAQYDLLAMIGYVYSTTNSKIFYVGHSQGTIMALAAFTMPNVVQMIESAALLCPISYLDHISSRFVLRAVGLHLDQLLLTIGIHQLNFRSDMGIQILDSVCDGHMDCNNLLAAITGQISVLQEPSSSELSNMSPLHYPHFSIDSFQGPLNRYQDLCWSVPSAFPTGENCCFNVSRVNYYLEYEPHPSSTKNLNHLFQMIRTGTFAKYDYGWLRNLIHYGHLHPPAFDLSKIPDSLPIWMGYGGSDALADVADVRRTINELRSKPELLYIDKYGHIDFILSVKAKDDVYGELIRFFRSQGWPSSY